MNIPSFEVERSVPRDASVLGVPVFTDLTTTAEAGAEIDRGFLAQRRFECQPGQAIALLADDGSTVVALGVGDRESVDAGALRLAGAALARNAGDAAVAATSLTASWPEHAQAVVEGVGLGAYRFEGNHNGRNGRNGKIPVPLERVVLVGRSGIRSAAERGRISVEATWRARDWVNLPPRGLTPRELARLTVEAAEAVGAEVEVWDEDRIADEKLGGLLGVASGASEPPRLIRVRHVPPSRPRARIALVGKGITFDSGGLSLKPAQSMMTMKDDMGGAAAVIAATLALAELGVRIEVDAWVAATENMPSGTAIHPGDVLTARNGTTIEVLNTDAEGRLVLADALSLAAESGPDAIIDVATLTGGQRVALGAGMSAVMGTDSALVRRVVEAGEVTGEPCWELPLFASYRKDLESEVADLRNVTAKPDASTIMAGLFLKEFAGGLPWAHLDIAAPAWADSESVLTRKGGTGWGTRTLIELVAGWASRRPG
jgi:leucyl aminopeptidase